MTDLALSYTSPLYGRRTRDLLLPPLPFRHAARFFRFSYLDSLEVYLTIGGIPEYLLKAGEYGDAGFFYRAEFFNRYGYFYHEPSFILSQEFRELKVYQSILQAMATGSSAPTTIARFCGMDTRHIYPYLESMIRLGFIEKETPVLVKPRTSIYRIRDPVFDFWYRFVFPRRQEIENGQVDPASLDMEPYFGKRFEAFVRQEFAPALFPGYRIGTWWRLEEEIDLIAVNEESSSIAFGECKWGGLTRDGAIGIIRRLKEKARLVRAAKYDRHTYALISAGNIEEKTALRTGDVLVFDRGDLERYLSD
jgi:AAA+ ATPase superfamily predicted ATPase